MANRHAHKKLRVDARARMARTGESYQTARARVAEGRRRGPSARRVGGDVDLLVVEVFGESMVVATFELLGRLSVVVVCNAHRVGLSMNPLFALGNARFIA